jgi:hypothetical protein
VKDLFENYFHKWSKLGEFIDLAFLNPYNMVNLFTKLGNRVLKDQEE